MPAGEAYDGKLRVIWLDTDPANLNAPTMAEVTAGVDLSGYAVPESIDPKASNTRVDGRDALSSFDPQAMGRFGYQPEIMFKSKLRSGGTVAWDTLGARLVTGTLLIFEDVTEGSAIAAGNRCDVYPSCETGAPLRQTTAINQERRFKVEFAVGAPPHLNVAVVA